MSRITVWYRGLGRGAKGAVITAAVLLVLAILGSIGYMVLSPEKVQVRYGTIVRDPVDGHVWEDHTKTAMVPPSQAGNYKVEYVDKLSPEHQQQAEQQQAEQAQQQAAQQQGPSLTTLQSPIDAKTMQDLNTLQQNIETAGNTLVSGMEMASKISGTKSTLVNYRNQLAGMSIPSQLEPLRQKGLQAFDMYIQACDLYLQGIATSDLAAIRQASDLITQANNMVRGLMPSK